MVSLNLNTTISFVLSDIVDSQIKLIKEKTTNVKYNSTKTMTTQTPTKTIVLNPDNTNSHKNNSTKP